MSAARTTGDPLAASSPPAGRVHGAGVASGKDHDSGRAPLVPLHPEPAESSAPQSGRLTERAQRFGRIGIIAIPIFAVFVGMTQRSSAAFSIDPAEYARYLSTGRYQTTELVVTLGVAATGLLSIISLAALLIRGRGRRFAIAGLIAGIIGSAALLVTVGTVIVRADRVRSALFHRKWAQMAINANAHGQVAALTVVSGALLLTIGWMLLGVAVSRTRGMNGSDGTMLIISAPLLYIGGMVLRVLPTIGAFLLVAAGLGIAFAAGRALDAAPASPLRTRRSPATARFVGAGIDDGELAAGGDAFAGRDGREALVERDAAGDGDPAGGAEGLAPMAAAADNGAGTINGVSLGGTPTDQNPADRTDASSNGAGHPGAHAGRGILGRARGARGISIAWPVTRKRDGDPRNGGRPDNDRRDTDPSGTDPSGTDPSDADRRADGGKGTPTGTDKRAADKRGADKRGSHRYDRDKHAAGRSGRGAAGDGSAVNGAATGGLAGNDPAGRAPGLTGAAGKSAGLNGFALNEAAVNEPEEKSASMNGQAAKGAAGGPAAGAGKAAAAANAKPNRAAESSGPKWRRAKAADINAADINAADINAADINAADSTAADINAADVNAPDINGSDINAADVDASGIEPTGFNAPEIRATEPDDTSGPRTGRE